MLCDVQLSAPEVLGLDLLVITTPEPTLAA